MKKCILVFLVLVSFMSWSQNYEVKISTENDFLGVGNNDENYTGGALLDFTTPEFKKICQPFFKFKDTTAVNKQHFAFGGTAYTPQDLNEENPIFDDRPYASLVFLNIGKISTSLQKNSLIQSDLIIGLMGGPGPGSVQTILHKNHFLGSTRPIPNGWQNQIGNGGAFIFNYNTKVQILLSKNDPQINTSNFKFCSIYGVGKLDVGNFMINLQGGFRFDLFNINYGLYDYNPVIYPTILFPEKFNDDDKEKIKKKNFKFNVFCEPNLRLVGYNATLEGLMFNDSSIHKLKNSDINGVLFELKTGVNFVFFNHFTLNYTFNGRSKEYSGGKPFHTWGTISIGGRF
jgi:lipid A 3-O-deacylase